MEYGSGSSGSGSEEVVVKRFLESDDYTYRHVMFCAGHFMYYKGHNTFFEIFFFFNSS